MKKLFSTALLVAFALPVCLWALQVIGYLDLQLMAPPGSPASGFVRLWADSGSSTVNCKTSSGTTCYFGNNSITVAAGTAALGTSAIASATCATVVTVSASNVAVDIAYTDLVIGSGSNTNQLTSAGNAFSSGQLGSSLVISGGTGFTTGTYRIISVNGTTAIMDRAVGTAASTSGTGTLVGDNVITDFNVDPTSTTGYSASSSGMLTIIKYPTAGNVNFKVCNNTSGSITPGAVTLNWRVTR